MLFCLEYYKYDIMRIVRSQNIVLRPYPVELNQGFYNESKHQWGSHVLKRLRNASNLSIRNKLSYNNNTVTFIAATYKLVHANNYLTFLLFFYNFCIKMVFFVCVTNNIKLIFRI